MLRYFFAEKMLEYIVYYYKLEEALIVCNAFWKYGITIEIKVSKTCKYEFLGFVKFTKVSLFCEIIEIS